MTIPRPAWRAPSERATACASRQVREQRHAWYPAMSHVGVYIDEEQKPRRRAASRTTPAG